MDHYSEQSIARDGQALAPVLCLGARHQWHRVRGAFGIESALFKRSRADTARLALNWPLGARSPALTSPAGRSCEALQHPAEVDVSHGDLRVTAVYGADGLRHVAAAGFIRWRLGGFSRWEANRAHTAFHRRLDFGVVRADSCVRGHRHWPVEQHRFNDYRSLQSSAAAGRIGGEPWRFLMARSGGFFVFRSEG